MGTTRSPEDWVVQCVNSELRLQQPQQTTSKIIGFSKETNYVENIDFFKVDPLEFPEISLYFLLNTL